MSKLTILSGGAIRGLITEAAPLFERTNETKVDARFALTSKLTKEIEDGAVFDVALLPRAELDALAERGRIAAGTQTDIARSAIGLCIRSGAARPDIGTVDALKRVLLGARSLGHSDGPSGAYVAELLGRLGIAEAVKPKIRLTSAPVAELVASGEAEIGIQQIVAILPVAGVELVGPLPSELQNIIVYTAGLSAQAANAAAARAFIGFIGRADVASIIRARGMEPA